MARIGYGQTKTDVIAKTQELVKKLNLSTPWDDDHPTEKWY